MPVEARPSEINFQLSIGGQTAKMFFRKRNETSQKDGGVIKFIKIVNFPVLHWPGCFSHLDDPWGKVELVK